MPGVDAGWRGGARARAATQAFLSLARAPRPPANQECERQHVTGLGRPRKFEMADGLLAAGELGSEAMGPEPERTGWAAEEKGECPPGQPGEPPAARGPRPPGRRGGGSCASPRRQSREASCATPVLPAPSDPGALGSALDRAGVPALGVRMGFRGTRFRCVSGVRGGGDRAPLPERRDRSLAWVAALRAGDRSAVRGASLGRTPVCPTVNWH